MALASIEEALAAIAHDYSVGAHILRDVGVTRLRVMTNSPAKPWPTTASPSSSGCRCDRGLAPSLTDGARPRRGR